MIAFWIRRLTLYWTLDRLRGKDPMPEGSEEVVMYWRPGCMYCMKLRLQLLFTPLSYRKVNIWRHPEAAAFVRSVADGNETVPTVTVGGKAMVNPSRRRLLAAVETHAPHLSAARPGR